MTIQMKPDNERSATNKETCRCLHAENPMSLQVFGKHSATAASIPLTTLMKQPVWIKDKKPKE
jgi:deoxycytidylate deaminase